MLTEIKVGMLYHIINYSIMQDLKYILMQKFCYSIINSILDKTMFVICVWCSGAPPPPEFWKGLGMNLL